MGLLCVEDGRGQGRGYREMGETYACLGDGERVSAKIKMLNKQVR